MQRLSFFVLCALYALALVASPARTQAQASSYTQANLVSDTTGVFKGTERRSAEAIAREMDSVGGMLDAFTSKEQICFNAKVSRQGFAVNGQPSSFIFETEDGTISGWNGAPAATLSWTTRTTPRPAWARFTKDWP